MRRPILEQIRDIVPAEPVPQSLRLSPVRVIAVTSGKGGVGKSNIVVNLGLALARLGHKVLLIDADLGLANLDILLGLTPRYTIYDFLSLRRSLTEIMVEGPEGIKILPASSGIPELADLDKHQKLFLLNELDDYTEHLDMVLIDTGAGISRNVLFFNLAAQERIVVANNEPTSITDAYALIKILSSRHSEHHFKLLVNGLSRPEEGKNVYRTLLRVIERFLGNVVSLEYLGVIPYDDAIPKAVLRQQPAISLFPQSRVSQSFRSLARRLSTSPPPPGLGSNVKFFWRRLLEYQV